MAQLSVELLFVFIDDTHCLLVVAEQLWTNLDVEVDVFKQTIPPHQLYTYTRESHERSQSVSQEGFWCHSPAGKHA